MNLLHDLCDMQQGTGSAQHDCQVENHVSCRIVFLHKNNNNKLRYQNWYVDKVARNINQREWEMKKKTTTSECHKDLIYCNIYLE